MWDEVSSFLVVCCLNVYVSTFVIFIYQMSLVFYFFMAVLLSKIPFIYCCLRFQIPVSTVRKLLSALPPSESSTFRVDFRSDHVHYLNNLEVDEMYKRWRSNLNEVPRLSDLQIVLFGVISLAFNFLTPASFCFRSWCQSSLDKCVTSGRTSSMLFMFWTLPPFAGLRQAIILWIQTCSCGICF